MKLLVKMSEALSNSDTIQNIKGIQKNDTVKDAEVLSKRFSEQGKQLNVTTSRATLIVLKELFQFIAKGDAKKAAKSLKELNTNIEFLIGNV